MEVNQDIRNRSNFVLRQWYRRIRESQFGHYSAYTRYKKLYYTFGIPAIILSTFIGTALFSTLSISTNFETQIIVGFISTISAIIAGLQTFFKFSQRADDHKKAAIRYGALRREIELLNTKMISQESDILEIIKSRVNDLADDSPPIPTKSWIETENKLKDDNSSFEIEVEKWDFNETNKK